MAVVDMKPTRHSLHWQQVAQTSHCLQDIELVLSTHLRMRTTILRNLPFASHFFCLFATTRNTACLLSSPVPESRPQDEDSEALEL